MAKTHALALCAGLALAGVAGFGAVTPAVAADAVKEQTAAAFHAGLAAGAKDVKTVRMHLHHVVNCLVGPAGAGYDEREMNPCKDAGAGLLADTPAGTPRTHFETALIHAQAGIKADDLAAAQKIAAETQALLK